MIGWFVQYEEEKIRAVQENNGVTAESSKT